MIWHMVSWYDGRMWTEVNGSLWRGDGRRYGEVRILYGKSRKIKRTDLGNLKKDTFMQCYIILVLQQFLSSCMNVANNVGRPSSRVPAKQKFW